MFAYVFCLASLTGTHAPLHDGKSAVRKPEPAAAVVTLHFVIGGDPEKPLRLSDAAARRFMALVGSPPASGKFELSFDDEPLARFKVNDKTYYLSQIALYGDKADATHPVWEADWVLKLSKLLRKRWLEKAHADPAEVMRILEQ